ncbi:hypothetical protein HBH74_056200 [Parastagonospora nodorum]|nr:hypothetical protein HBH73_165450 [Parastagonospora nodorum]KAH4943824.1 hypothetical protein HBH74_056200 [Parastagonospora nodorum]KAH5542044.1 hypothetical protein HBI27_083890 [Parastagonospora nodorum]
MADYMFEKFKDARSEIRILTVLPGSTKDPVSCTLESASLDSLPVYEALSYTWGNNDTKNPIQIDGKRFIAFGNAQDALVELRDAISPRRIWIDAICINQEDLEEKQHQILLMKAVYEKASRVVIWFPRPRGNADLAVDLLNELNEQHDAGTHTVQSMQGIHRTRMRSSEWTALRDFLHHPWWRRVWTFQEVVVGRNVVIQYGRHMIPWKRMHILGDDNSMLYSMFIKEPGEGEDFGVGHPDGCSAIPIIQWLRDLLEAGERCSLLDLLPQCWFRQATNIRDCIYGLCALASDVDSLGIIPDYSKSVEDVLTDAVNKILLKYGTFELFCKAGCGFDRNFPGLPSYVPDWTNIPAAQPLYWHFYEGPQTVPLAERGINLHEDGQLQLKIYEIDYIEHISTKLHSTAGEDEYKQLISWFDAAEKLAITHARDPYTMTIPQSTSIPLFEAFWRTTIADSANTSNRTRPLPDTYHGYLRWKYTLSHHSGISATSLFEDIEQYSDRYRDPMDDTLAKMVDWYNTVLVTSWDRAFCVTRGGMVGLVPGGARPGDLVCLIPGGAVPFVMRMRASVNECELVGESYFHGVGAIEGVKQLRGEGKEPSVVFLV